jgi:hypothetical protein
MRKILLLIGIFFAIALCLSIVLHSPVGALIALVVVVGGPLLVARFVGRERSSSGSLYWRGYVSFAESSLGNRRMFPDLHRHSRIGGWGRRGLSSGKCEIRDSGIAWRSGGWATPQTEVSGTLDLPWSAVEAFEAHRIPGKLPGLGGGFTLKLSEDEGVITGEFFGSLRGISRALSSHAAPLAE